MPLPSLDRRRARGPRGALRVAVADTELRARARDGGDRRAWRGMLDALDERGVEVVDGAGRPGRRADVWMVSGHRPLPATLRDDGALPVVCHLHEAPWEDPEQRHLLDPYFRESMLAWGREATARATRVVCDSRQGARQVVAVFGVSAARVDAVALGCDPAVFRPGGPRPELAGAGPYVLFVGAAHPRKNLAALREAMQLLVDRPGAGRPRLVCVLSPAADRADPVGLLDEASRPPAGVALEVRRWVDEAELAALYAHAHLLVLPSLGEGFGLPALEAMACATPVVVSDRGALPEVVGEAGTVCAPQAPALADAMHRLLADPGHRAERAAAARRRAGQLTWQHTAAGLHAALERAVEEHR